MILLMALMLGERPEEPTCTPMWERDGPYWVFDCGLILSRQIAIQEIPDHKSQAHEAAHYEHHKHMGSVRTPGCYMLIETDGVVECQHARA